MNLQDLFNAAMLMLVVAVPVSLTAVVSILLRVAAGGGVPRIASYPPPGVVTRAERTSARIRARYLRRARGMPARLA